jgi:glutathionyl-hydroquinone reductase
VRVGVQIQLIEALREQIDELNGWIYDNVNNGVYKAGFATSQQAYDDFCRLIADDGLLFFIPEYRDGDAAGVVRVGVQIPPALREQIDELNGWIYDNVNNGVYKAGFATSQQASADSLLTMVCCFLSQSTGTVTRPV